MARRSILTPAKRKQRFHWVGRFHTKRERDTPRAEIRDWMNAEGNWSDCEPVPNGYLPAVTALYNFAIDEDDLPPEAQPRPPVGEAD